LLAPPHASSRYMQRHQAEGKGWWLCAVSTPRNAERLRGASYHRSIAWTLAGRFMPGATTTAPPPRWQRRWRVSGTRPATRAANWAGGDAKLATWQHADTRHNALNRHGGYHLHLAPATPLAYKTFCRALTGKAGVPYHHLTHCERLPRAYRGGMALGARRRRFLRTTGITKPRAFIAAMPSLP